jgi:putative MATE family efflux protein
MQDAESIETLPDGELLPEDAPSPAPKPRKYDRSIVEGPLGSAVWKIAWPAILANIFSGLQNWVDQIMVGNFIGYEANAAIGVANQIFIAVIVFISSVFIGMSVLVSRFVGANDHERANRAVYQGFLVAIVMSLGILAPLGYFSAPYLLHLVTSDAAVLANALPFLRIMFVFSIGLLIYFMLSGALRSAGDSRTPMVLGVVMTVLNLVLNIILIRGLGPIPAFGAAGSAMGTCIATGMIGAYALFRLIRGGWVVSFPKGGYAPDWKIIKQLFKFGLPAGIQGIAMNVGGVMMLWFMGSLQNSAATQAVYAVCYGQLFSLITWGSNALMGASAAVAGQNLGAGNPDRAKSAVNTAARIGVTGALIVGLVFFFFPTQLLMLFGMTQAKDPAVIAVGIQLLRVLSLSGLFISAALAYTGGLQGTGDTKGPLYISIISQVVLPLGICFVISKTGTLEPLHIWLAILAGHVTRCVLSFLRFNQGKWRSITVEIEHTAA